MRCSFPTLLAALALTFAAGVSAQTDPASLELPDLGEPADLTISPAQEAKLRGQVAAELYSGDYLVDDVEVSDYIKSVGWKLAAKGSAHPPDFTFFVIGDPRINAFAVPGGLVGINAGLILAADNESELAGVLGHEEAHVTQRHLARTANDTQAATIATWAVALAAVIAGSANPDLILGALAVGQGINQQREVNYTRAHEQEADRIGITTMAQAGYDPEAMATFFSKLEVQGRLYGAGVPEILRTHPVNTSRISEARSRAEKLPKVKLKDSPDFGFIKARTAVFMADRANEALELFASRLKAGDRAPANIYGYAFALDRVGRSAEALAALAPLLPSYPKQINVNILQAQLLIATGKGEEGRALLGKMLALYPRSAPVMIADARALLDAGQPEAARNVLLSRDPAFGNWVELHKLLADAARVQGNIAETQFQTASYADGRGDLREAITQLQAGLRLSSLSNQDRNRLQAYRDDIVRRIPRADLAEFERQDRRLLTIN